MSTQHENISPDLIWEVCRTYILTTPKYSLLQLQSFRVTSSNQYVCVCTGHNNAYLVKRKSGGGVQFSRDPMNLTNVHSRKNAGFINDKAIGILPDSNTVQLPFPPCLSNQNLPTASLTHQTSSN